MLKSIIYLTIYLFSVILFVPVSVSFLYNGDTIFKNNDISKQEIEEELEIIDNVEILNLKTSSNETNKPTVETSKPIVETNNFEDYIIGVLAAEMPISFDIEALKAQAIAARTYAYKRVDNINEKVEHKSIGQAFNTIEEMKQKWGNNFDEYYKKVENAVYDTKGIIMTYEDEPIEAVFHSTSAGITEVSENIWGKNLPYIESVESKVDEKAPNFIYTTTVPNSLIIQKISEKYKNIDKNKIISTFEISERSKAGYVLNVLVDGEKIGAREIRTMFSLRSTNFTIKKNNDSIAFTTKGYGHGAGMSQYGANFMAEEGKNYEKILNHYYKGIKLQKVY